MRRQKGGKREKERKGKKGGKRGRNVNVKGKEKKGKKEGVILEKKEQIKEKRQVRMNKNEKK